MGAGEDKVSEVCHTFCLGVGPSCTIHLHDPDSSQQISTMTHSEQVGLASCVAEPFKQPMRSKASRILACKMVFGAVQAVSA